MKNYLLLILICFNIFELSAQKLIEINESMNGSHEIVAINSVKLQPGFQYTAIVDDVFHCYTDQSQEDLSVDNSENEFVVGMFGFRFMETGSKSGTFPNELVCSLRVENQKYDISGHPTSHLNVLASDGFNVVTNYIPNTFSASQIYLRSLLELVGLHDMKMHMDAQGWALPQNVDKTNGYPYNAASMINIYANEGQTIGNITIGGKIQTVSGDHPELAWKAHPHYENYFEYVYSTPVTPGITDLSDVIWGHHITEESTSAHPWNPLCEPIGYQNNPYEPSEAARMQKPVSNVEDAINDFREYKNQWGIPEKKQKLVVMEANHGRGINDNTNFRDPKYTYLDWQFDRTFTSPQEYIQIENPSGVFFEGSYTTVPDGWEDQDYSNIENNEYHYLGQFSSIDYAKDYYEDVHKVINISCEKGTGPYWKDFNTNEIIENGNWLWFQAYNSIIHGAKGIWFWDLGYTFEECEKESMLINNSVTTQATIIANARASCSGLTGYSDAEIHCSSTELVTCNTVTKTIGDVYNNEVATIWNNWWYSWDERFEADNFSLSYKKYISNLSRELMYLVDKSFITSKGKDILYVKTINADNYGIVPPVIDYTGALEIDPEKKTENYGLRYSIRSNGNEVIMIISNPLNVSLIDVDLDFTKISNKIIRNSDQVEFLFDLRNTSVNSNLYKIDRDSHIDLDNLTVINKNLEPFNGTLQLSFGPMDVHIIKFSGSSGWNENVVSDNTVMPYTPLKYGNGQMFYVRNDGKIHCIEKENDNWLNPNAPIVKPNGGFELVPSQNNDVYYVAVNNQIIRMYWDGTDWAYEMPISTSMNVANYSELHFSNNQIFYIRNDGIIHSLYKLNDVWTNNWLNPNAPAARLDCDFEVNPNNNEIYYIGTNGRLYKMYWDNQSESWLYESTSPDDLLVKNNSELHYGDGQLIYTRNDGVLYSIYESGGNWIYGPLNANAETLKDGTGFEFIPEQDLIYYIGADSYIYKMTWTSSLGWESEKLIQYSTDFNGAIENSDIVFGNNLLYYVGLEDSRVHNLSFVYDLPFSISSSNTNTGDNWDVQGCDATDIEYLFYLPTASYVTASTCNSITDFDTRIEIFNLNGTRTGYYNDDNTCTENQYASTITSAELEPGYYYIVVDGYCQTSGNFDITVTSSFTKSNSVSQPNVDVIANDEDIDKYNNQDIISSTIESTLLSDSEIINIFPNPATNHFTVKSLGKEINTVYLFDLQGRIISQYVGNYSNEINMDCNGIASGVYFVKVLVGENIKTYKLSIR